MPSNSIKAAAVLLKSNGVSLFRNASGEFQIRLCNSARNAPYYFTDDLDDAVATGLRMADERDAAEAEKTARAALQNYHRSTLEQGANAAQAYLDAANHVLMLRAAANA